MNLIQELTDRIDQAGLWQKTLALDRNEYLKVKGSADTRIFLVMSGCLRAFITDEYEEHTIRFGYKGSVILAIDSFVTGKPSDLYIQAIRKTELKVLAKEPFVRFMEEAPEHMELWMKILQQLVVQQLERERDLLTASPQERYNRVLKRSPQLFQEVPGKYIASYLRMTPETLSRMKKS